MGLGSLSKGIKENGDLKKKLIDSFNKHGLEDVSRALSMAMNELRQDIDKLGNREPGPREISRVEVIDLLVESAEQLAQKVDKTYKIYIYVLKSLAQTQNDAKLIMVKSGDVTNRVKGFNNRIADLVKLIESRAKN